MKKNKINVNVFFSGLLAFTSVCSSFSVFASETKSDIVYTDRSDAEVAPYLDDTNVDNRNGLPYFLPRSRSLRSIQKNKKMIKKYRNPYMDNVDAQSDGSNTEKMMKEYRSPYMDNVDAQSDGSNTEKMMKEYRSPYMDNVDAQSDGSNTEKMMKEYFDAQNSGPENENLAKARIRYDALYREGFDAQKGEDSDVQNVDGPCNGQNKNMEMAKIKYGSLYREDSDAQKGEDSDVQNGDGLENKQEKNEEKPTKNWLQRIGNIVLKGGRE
jgi:hypothetical protein